MARKASKGRKPYFLTRLTRHLGGVDPAKLAVIEQTFQPYERPNVHLAIEKMLGARGVRAEVEGVLLDEEYHSVSLAKLSRDVTARHVLSGPVEYHDIEIADGKRLACVKRALYWIKTPVAAGGPLVMLVHQPLHSYPPKI